MSESSISNGLKFFIVSGRSAWVGFASAEEAQTYWSKIPSGNRRSGHVTFYHQADFDAEPERIVQAYPEILKGNDPRIPLK